MILPVYWLTYHRRPRTPTPLHSTLFHFSFLPVFFSLACNYSLNVCVCSLAIHWLHVYEYSWDNNEFWHLIEGSTTFLRQKVSSAVSSCSFPPHQQCWQRIKVTFAKVLHSLKRTRALHYRFLSTTQTTQHDTTRHEKRERKVSWHYLPTETERERK